jgi:hypothetical protein
MKLVRLSFLVFLFGAIAVSGQDTKLDDFALFDNVKDTVRRNISQGIAFGFDVKVLHRSGDVVAIAIVKTIPESELTSPTKMKRILGSLRSAFNCPSRCVESPGNRQPKVTMLLLEHLHNNTTGPAQAEVDKTREFIVRQTTGAE